MGEDFTATFTETFSVAVARWPKHISVQIWEKGMLRDTFVSQVGHASNPFSKHALCGRGLQHGMIAFTTTCPNLYHQMPCVLQNALGSKDVCMGA